MYGGTIGVYRVWRVRDQHQPDIWGLTKGMLQKIYFTLVKNILCLLQQNVGLVGTYTGALHQPDILLY